jgi:hypothetical protein
VAVSGPSQWHLLAQIFIGCPLMHHQWLSGSRFTGVNHASIVSRLADAAEDVWNAFDPSGFSAA